MCYRFSLFREGSANLARFSYCPASPRIRVGLWVPNGARRHWDQRVKRPGTDPRPEVCGLCWNQVNLIKTRAAVVETTNSELLARFPLSPKNRSLQFPISHSLSAKLESSAPCRVFVRQVGLRVSQPWQRGQ